MHHPLKKLVLGMIFLLPSSQVHADLWIFNVTLDGLQEVPPNASPGLGTATAIFDDISGAMNITGNYSGLLAPAIDAHLHGYAPMGSNAGVVFGLSFNPSTAGTINGNGVIPAARIPDVLNGLTYINIHSAVFPGGEIRGQLINPSLVPEPGSAGIISIIGLCVMCARRRRRIG
ncbi:MAG TPA: CHRD domain-containing protein [Pirellulaceae bacterium]|nr:CHRD domain-containing protein [Pirellulaceae bacterium]HMO93919.1 CHRD domain-containing protein [Pirellulaceae bacterium]HMP68957.1 CHRD domain-containing protein [Pirellulaceae bacterium]